MAEKATPDNIRRLAQELQERGIANFDRPVKELMDLRALDDIPGLSMKDPSVLGWYVVGGSSYVVVCE